MGHEIRWVAASSTAPAFAGTSLGMRGMDSRSPIGVEDRFRGNDRTSYERLY